MLERTCLHFSTWCLAVSTLGRHAINEIPLQCQLHTAHCAQDLQVAKSEERTTSLDPPSPKLRHISVEKIIGQTAVQESGCG
jgi:hypothetical protein